MRIKEITFFLIVYGWLWCFHLLIEKVRIKAVSCFISSSVVIRTTFSFLSEFVSSHQIFFRFNLIIDNTRNEEREAKLYPIPSGALGMRWTDVTILWTPYSAFVVSSADTGLNERQTMKANQLCSDETQLWKSLWHKAYHTAQLVPRHVWTSFCECKWLFVNAHKLVCLPKSKASLFLLGNISASYRWRFPHFVSLSLSYQCCFKLPALRNFQRGILSGRSGVSGPTCCCCWAQKHLRNGASRCQGCLEVFFSPSGPTVLLLAMCSKECAK